MPAIRVADDLGYSINLMKTARTGDCYYIPNMQSSDFNQEDEINAWDTWEARGDDVILCTYPKSGTHWLWEITCMLLRGNASRIQDRKENWMLERISKQTFDNLPSPRVLNSHVFFNHLPQDFKKKKCKIVNMMRNPKDVAVSYFHHHRAAKIYDFQGEWKNYLYHFLQGNVDYGRWTDYILNWRQASEQNKDIPIHFTTYEDMHKDNICEIRMIAEFLNVPENNILLESIAEACQFQKMKKDKDSIEPCNEWRDKMPAMYRKGKVGDWKNLFTDAQTEYFDGIIEKQLQLPDKLLQ